MKAYPRITIFENRRRVNVLKKFKKSFNEWLSNINYLGSSEISETDRSARCREEMNLIMNEVDNIIIQSAISPKILYSPAPIRGGFQGEIDIILNVFGIFMHRIPKEEVIDRIDQSIGVYNSDMIPSIFRAINPFFWISNIIGYFYSGLIGFIGSSFHVDPKKIEGNILLKVFRFFIDMFVNAFVVLSAVKTLHPEFTVHKCIEYIMSIFK